MAYHLFYNIFTTTRSAVSKLVEPEEVGKIFGLIYQATLHILPCLWILTMSAFVNITLIITIVTHVGMTKEIGSKRVRDYQDECNREYLVIIVQCKSYK